jgi:hypothetical protein
MLLADRYDDRTHFIFELLQNAEDALSRRGAWNGSRRVTFDLMANILALSHFGKPFDEADVRGVCGIAESTKDQFSIGRFGIGFKSVYTFSDRPEIHSGREDFAIENYVQPNRMDYREREPDETLIILPLKSEDETARQEITEGFKRLGANALLFLRHIDEINWNVHGGASGIYLRSAPEHLGSNVQRITVIGQESDQKEVDQTWLVFNRDVFSSDQEKVGRVEIAFSLQSVKDTSHDWSIQPVITSPLVVFFPTVVSTNLGFLIQGPYRTTPSRDNIPRNDPWNQHLIKETASLLVEAMRWLRDSKMLNTSALHCLPLDRKKFPEESMFAPLFDTVRQALMEEKLLPRFDGGYVAAPQARLARTHDLRELVSPEQLALLFNMKVLVWLTGDITQDKAAEIRQYLIYELGITEVTPATLIQRLNREFLEAQSDEWIVRLYEFLSTQESALRNRLNMIPLIRLSDGTHVVAFENEKARVFLPSTIETSFPTVRLSVCSKPMVRRFLLSIGITEPDPVDDVIWNILPKYRQNKINLTKIDYTTDIKRIISAFNTDSKIQREKLLSALRETPFVMAVNTSSGETQITKPSTIYIATDRLKRLFADVPNILIINDSYDCLRGENARELLEACGALRHPRPVHAPDTLTRDEQRELRQQAGHEETSGIKDQIVDWTLQGFDDLLKLLPKLTPSQRIERAKIIWESLTDLEERRGRGIFEGTYTWSHYGNYKKEFPSAFLRRLNTSAWIPNSNGELQPPNFVVFDSLDWETNPFLLTKIKFKPLIIDQLAKEAGIEPETLNLLKKLGITSVADLITRLGIIDLPPETKDKPEKTHDNGEPYSRNADDDAKDLYWDNMPKTPPRTLAPENRDDTMRNSTERDEQNHIGDDPHNSGQDNGNTQRGSNHPSNGNHEKRSTDKARGCPFISYVGTHHDEEESDPDGLNQVTRMRIEEQAIKLIIELEPTLHRTPNGNPGFDLYESDHDGKMVRWVEVKSMTGSLEDRPVGLSRTQFNCARDRGAAYWLYIVEHAMDSTKARILRIQDPFAHARTFTFDRGWSQIAQMKPLS